MRRLGEEGRGEEEGEAGFVPSRGSVMEEGPVSAVAAGGLGTLGEEIAVLCGRWILWMSERVREWMSSYGKGEKEGN